MKKLSLLFLIISCAIQVWAADNKTAAPTQVSTFTITAPAQVQLLGKTYYFSHWECMNKPYQQSFTSTICSTENTLVIDIRKPSMKDYRGVPYIEAIFRPQSASNFQTAVAELSPSDEYVSFMTDGHKDPYAYLAQLAQQNNRDLEKDPIIRCGNDVITSVQTRSQPVMLTIGKLSTYGTMGVARISKEKKSTYYIKKLCQEKFPDWFTQIAQLMPGKQQPVAQNTPRKTTTTKPRPVKPPQKTVIPKLQLVPTNFRAGSK